MFLMNGRKGNACSLLIPYVFSDKINHGALGYIKHIAEHICTTIIYCTFWHVDCPVIVETSLNIEEYVPLQ